MIEYLTTEHVLTLHQKSINVHGGDSGYFDNTINKVDGILAQQYPIFGYDKYPDIFTKGAMLLYFLAKGHCFVDGNKRVAILSTIVFLYINGYEPIFSNEQGERKTLDVASSQVNEANRTNRNLLSLSPDITIQILH